MSKITKVSLSLPSALVVNLDYLSARLGISRSALVAQMLDEGVTEARRILELIRPNPTPAEVLRLRGQSIETINARLDNLKAMTNDLFSE